MKSLFESLLSLDAFEYSIKNILREVRFTLYQLYKIFTFMGEDTNALLQLDETCFFQNVTHLVSQQPIFFRYIKYHQAPSPIPACRAEELGSRVNSTTKCTHTFVGNRQFAAALDYEPH